MGKPRPVVLQSSSRCEPSWAGPKEKPHGQGDSVLFACLSSPLWSWALMVKEAAQAWAWGVGEVDTGGTENARPGSVQDQMLPGELSLRT